jgi:hypothetical protein
VRPVCGEALVQQKGDPVSKQRFRATVTQSGSRVAIVLPFNPDEAWGMKQRHHVTGSINNCDVRGSLGSDGDQYVLPLGAAWRRDTGIKVGAEVDVELVPEGPQVDALAPDILAALDTEPEARAFFESLATFYRTGYLRWIDGARRAEARSERITEMLGLLKAGKKQR